MTTTAISEPGSMQVTAVCEIMRFFFIDTAPKLQRNFLKSWDIGITVNKLNVMIFKALRDHIWLKIAPRQHIETDIETKKFCYLDNYAIISNFMQGSCFKRVGTGLC